MTDGRAGIDSALVRLPTAAGYAPALWKALITDDLLVVDEVLRWSAAGRRPPGRATSPVRPRAGP